MNTVKDLRILIIDPDTQFREELYNFLLLAGCKTIDAAKNFTEALTKIRDSSPDVVLLDASAPSMKRLEHARHIVALNQKIKVILMIKAEDQQDWNEKEKNTAEFHFMIKTDFAQYLLFLLKTTQSHSATE